MATDPTYGAASPDKHTAILRDSAHRSAGPGPDLMDTATLTGDAVVNALGEPLGTLEAIMLDVAAGQVAYAVLSFSGHAAQGDKLFAIPWSVFTLDAPQKRFVLDVDRERLENAPGFDNEHWPKMADREWAIQLHDYYEEEPYWDDTLSASSG